MRMNVCVIFCIFFQQDYEESPERRPHIIRLEREHTYAVKLEDCVLTEELIVEKAVEIFFSTFFVFNLQYTAPNTLEFLQR